MLATTVNRIGVGLTKGPTVMLSSPSAAHCDHSHTKTKQNQQRVENCRGRFWLLGCRRFCTHRKFKWNLDLRACAGLEAPLRIRFKSSAIKLLVSGTLLHSHSANPACLLINGHQNHAFSCEPLFLPFRPVNRLRRVDRPWRLWPRRRSSDLRLQRRSRDEREQENERERRNILHSGTS